jgi:hypothetical protein
VPEGSYVLVLVDGNGVIHSYETSSSAVDLGYDVLGRGTAVLPTLATSVTLELTWPDEWNQAGDELVLTASNADVLDVAISGTRLDAGAVQTPLDPLLVEAWDVSSSGGPLNLLAAEDTVYVHHLVSQAAPVLHQAARSASGPLAGITIADGTGGTIAAALTAPVGSGAVTLDWRTTQFEAFLASMGPAATADAMPHRLRIGASAHPLASPAPVATRSPTLLRVPAASGTADLVGVPLAFSRFLDPALWNEWIEGEFLAHMSYTAPGATTPLDEPVAVHARAAYVDSAGSTLVQPVVRPVTAPLMNAVSAFTAQTGVGPTPLLAWTAPGGAPPASYAVTIYRLSASGISSTRTVVGSFTTAATQLRLPSNVVVPGSTYYARIEARSGAPDPLAPLRAGNVGASAGVLTATFAP